MEFRMHAPMLMSVCHLVQHHSLSCGRTHTSNAYLNLAGYIFPKNQFFPTRRGLGPRDPYSQTMACPWPRQDLAQPGYGPPMDGLATSWPWPRLTLHGELDYFPLEAYHSLLSTQLCSGILGVGDRPECSHASLWEITLEQNIDSMIPLRRPPKIAITVGGRELGLEPGI